ncbi:MAG TPA: helix-turn-helix domain-containing protein [Acidimicrobiales bacterium]|nr:helix-turn-helix domain-containing protein [Acidimicrobiales bacterium]
MTTEVKGRPPGAAPGQARTRFARAAVVEGARALFVERGYAATTIDAISERSDVPSATVYRLFTSKLGILSALLEVSIVGDDDPVALQDRPDAKALFAEADPRKQLAGFAAIARQINVRAAPVYRVLVGAAASELEAAELLAEYTRRRQTGQGQIARLLARAGALREEVKERDAADVIHALMSPEVFRLLVSDRGWSPDRYERWLAHTLADQLMAR